MSHYTSQYLATNQLIGFTEKRGKAWWYRASEDTGAQSNHYTGAIPVGDVETRLFPWRAEPRRVAVEIPASFETMTHLAEDGTPMAWVIQEDRQAIVRGDNHHVMGMFKDGYEPHQYREWLLNTVSTILGDTLAIGSAGVLKHGAMAYVQVEVPDSIETPEGVTFRPNLLSATSFDGSVATTFKRTCTVVVCDNTYEIAMGELGQTYKVKHTRNSGFKLKDARAALAVVEQAADDFSAEVKALCETAVTDKDWFRFLDTFVPLEEAGKKKEGRSLTMAQNKQDELRRLWNHDQRVSPWKGTAFGVVQASNTYDHHIGIVRNTSRPERNMLSAITGTQGKSDAEVLTVLTKVLAAV